MQMITASSTDNFATKIKANIINNAKFYRSRILIMICVCFISMFSLGAYIAFCEDEPDANSPYAFTNLSNGDPGKLYGLTKQIYKWIQDIYGVKEDGTSILDEVGNILNVKYAAGDSPAYEVGGQVISLPGVNTVYKIFCNVGVMLVIVYFCIGLLEELSFNQMYAEKIVKKFMYLVIALIVVSQSMVITYGAANLGTAVMERVLETTNSTSNIDMSAIKDQLGTECQSADFIEEGFHPIKTVIATFKDTCKQISYLITLLIPWAISKVCYLVVQFICWSRFFEIALMGIVSPVSFSDIARGNPMQSSAMRVFKNIIAISLTGAVILLICYICNAISGQIFVNNVVDTNNIGTAAWEAVLIAIVQAGMIKRSSELTKQMLGMA